MKISEAIRKGSVGKKQIKKSYFNSDRTGCCAIGAAVLGCRLNTLSSLEDFTRDIEDKIIRYNDDCGYSFEAIAAILEEQGL